MLKKTTTKKQVRSIIDNDICLQNADIIEFKENYMCGRTVSGI